MTLKLSLNEKLEIRAFLEIAKKDLDKPIDSFKN